MEKTILNRIINLESQCQQIKQQKDTTLKLLSRQIKHNMAKLDELEQRLNQNNQKFDSHQKYQLSITTQECK